MTAIDLSKNQVIMDMRESIDRFDISFLHLLSERMRIVKKIMFIKFLRQIDLSQSNARKEDMKELIEMSVRLSLEKKFFKKILDLVFQDAIEQFNSEEVEEKRDSLVKVCDPYSLEDLRNSLLNLDKSLCFILAERFCVVKKIGIYKDQLNVPPLDPKRWQQVLDNKVKTAGKVNLSTSLVKNIFNSIHEVSLDIERRIEESKA